VRKIKHKKIQAFERDQIALWKGEGGSNKEVSRRLGRSPSSVGRELKRNSFEGKTTLPSI